MRMLCEIKRTKTDVVYPQNYFGSYNEIQEADEHHHVGGAIFNKDAINAFKFSKMRSLEGADFFQRASQYLKVGYYKEPIFFYSQRTDSMSKTDLRKRADVQYRILSES